MTPHYLSFLLLLLAPLTSTHGIAHAPPNPSAPWAHRHLASEHHITNYDHGAFFTLHDTDSDGYLSTSEISRMYGASASQSPSVIQKILALVPHAADDRIAKNEWMRWAGELPDLGTGIGHHGDEEYEYEIHHFEEFHGEDADGEGEMHPEDVEHFKRHEEMDKAEERERVLEKTAVNLNNIPRKFRVGMK